jgi:hypothetical protein
MGKERRVCVAADGQVTLAAKDHTLHRRLPAKRQAIVDSKNTASAFKRLIGCQFKDKEVQDDAKHWSVALHGGLHYCLHVHQAVQDREQG